MEEFIADEKTPASSEVKSDDKPKKEEPNPFKLTMNHKEGTYIPSENLSFDSPLSNTEREKVGSYYLSQDPFKILSKQQSAYAQVANAAEHVVTNFIGDTFQSVGATYQIGKDILNEVKNKDAEFSNDLMDFGNAIKDWGKNNFPNYRENPNESWDVTDPAWWTDGVESAFSSLSFLVGGLGAVKGIGALAKLTKAEQLLAKTGANVEKLKLGTKIATSASFARNAENMMESYQLRQDVKTNLTKEWDEDPSKFDEVANSEVGKELGAEGREVTKENLANFIAGKAGWKAYAINSLNIVFDAMQMAPLFKGFNPSTRLGKMATSSKIREANAKLLNPTAKGASLLGKTFDILNPLVSGVGRSLSEGVEEAVNYIGTEEGKNLANELTNKSPDTSFGTRLSKYLKSGDLYESAFWGTLGGGLFQGSANLLNKGLNLSKGIKSNSEADNRVNEINNRLSILEDSSKKIKDIDNDPDLDNNSKHSLINNIKSELSLDLGLRAAQAGNIDLLLDQVRSKEYKDKLIDSGISDEIGVDKTVAKTASDIILAERLYKNYYNSFQIAPGSNFVKHSLINRSVVADYFIHKNEERRNSLSKELEDLKAADPSIRNSENRNLETLLQMEGLKVAKTSIEKYINNAKKAEDNLLSDKGKLELERINTKLASLKEQVGEDKLDLKEINPDIITKQAEIILMDGVNNIQSSKIKEYRSPEYIKKEEDKVAKDKSEFEQEVFDDFKKDIEDKVSDGRISSNILDDLIKEHSKDSKKVNFLKKIKDEVTANEESQNRKKEVDEILSFPVNNGTIDEFEGLPQYDVVDLDESKVSPAWKSSLDKFIEDRDIFNLQGVTGDALAAVNPYEVQYVKNKIQHIRNNASKNNDVRNLNATISNDSYEFEFNEDAQVEGDKPKLTIDHLLQGGSQELEVANEDEGIEFLSKEVAENPIRTYLPIFDYNLEHFNFKEYASISKGDIIVKDKYTDLIKTIFDPNFKVGTEIDIVWDEKNPYTRPESKGDIDNEAFKLIHKGVVVSYIPTKNKTEANIKFAERRFKETGDKRFSALADKLKLELPQTLKLRKQLELTDKVQKVKLTAKGNGTVISRGIGKSYSHSVDGIFKDFYALNPSSYLDKTSLLNISTPDDSFSSVSQLRPGIIYGRLESANGTPIPVPLTVSKVNLVQAKEIQSHIENLLVLLNEGKDSENEEVRKLKDSIAKYIKVDRASNYDKPTGFRVFPQGKKEDGTISEARIEMTYYNQEGKKLLAVIRISSHGSGSYVGVFGDGKKIHQTTIDSQEFNKILQRKYQNIDFSLLTKNQPFSFDGKSYSSYKDYIIKEEVIKTDIAQVKDKEGNLLSNLYGFDNDFTIAIGSEIVGKEKQETIFQSSAYENELKAKDTVADDTSYRSNYSIYNNSIVDPKSVLDDILKNPLNDNIRDVATFLQSNISKASFTIQLGDKIKDDSPALFSADKNTILVNNKRQFSEVFLQQTLLHEMLHAVTVSSILKSLVLTPQSYADFKKEDYIDVSSIPFKDNAPQYVKNFVTELVTLRNDTISQLTKKYGKTLQELTKDTKTFYGLENPFEFISEAMVNPNFRNQLKDLENGSNILTNLYNRIIDFLNNLFGTNISKINDNKLKASVNLIKNFVNQQKEISPINVKDLFYSRTLDKFDNNFTREEINETVNSFQGLILKNLREGKLEERSSYDSLRKSIEYYKDNICPESCKDKTNLVNHYFEQFFQEAYKRINKNFKVSTSFDIEDIQENQEVTKEWNDKAAQQVSSQDTVTNQIKMFIMTVPEIKSLDVQYDKDNNPIWDTKKSTLTGLSTYVDFNTIYPYLIRNIIGARSMSDIINKMNIMSKVKPCFAYIANELQKDANLLAQFESNLAKKYVYDSYVTFISNIENQKQIWTSNELKSTKYDYLIADDWGLKINRIIDSVKTPNDKLEFDKRVTSIYHRISQKSKNPNQDITGLTADVHELADTLGIDLSLSTIQGRLENSRNWSDFEIMKALDGIYGSISREKKNDDFGRLNTLAKLEALVRFEVVENSGLDIKGNLIYAIRNPNFISNWFINAKSDTKEGRQQFEDYLNSLSRIPEFQFSNWLWTDSTSKGFLAYEIVNGKKVPVKNAIDWEFVKNFNFHNFGGAKEVVTKNTQDYTDFSEKDWQLLNLINYIRPDEKTARTKGKDKEFILIPSLIPSDSGTMYTFEVSKVKLGPSDLDKNRSNLKVIQGTPIFNALLNTNRQEIRRIQQATQQIFDIVDNKLVVKKDLDTSILQQYQHYGKELDLDNLTDSLLDKDGNPKGKIFYFNNMLVKRGDNWITLDDIEGVKINGHLGIGEVSSSVIQKIKDFTQEFANQQVNEAYKDYKSLETEIAEKHDNVSDGSFQNLIAEYVLNTYIHNVEQFNFFNGSITEYKDKIDTNKRAKQMFAPGIGLSIESMKIKYENGNYSDGNIFNAITLKDVKTKSATFNFISSSVRDLLEKEQPSLSEEELTQQTKAIIDGYKSINAGDAQGYITLDRYEQLLRGLGRFTPDMEAIFDKARKGESLNTFEIKAFQPIKGFYYGREYNPISNKLESNQIKYSSMPLLPQLVKGTDLEKLMNHMNANNIEEAFYESAHKIGAKSIYKIQDEEGNIDDALLKKAKLTPYYNRNWQLQLDVPEHILDAENLLATQIAKLIIANLDPSTSYDIGGKSYKKDELIKHYFNLLETNIIESANELVNDLGVQKDENGFTVKDKDIQRLLKEEVEKRGLSDNYSYSIEIDSNGDFRLPLFVNSMSTKWEAILTSLFTNRIVRQKQPGGSVVLGSRLFLDNKVTQSEAKLDGIEWSKEKENDHTLKSYREEDGKLLVAEILLSSWSSNLFNKGQRISLDDIPDEIKTMIGYRIPTQAKHSMLVFKVVGFLPEQNRGLIVTPDDLVTQMGSDFDIDKLFLMNKNFYTTDEGKFITPKLGNEKAERDEIEKEIKKLYSELYSAEKFDKDLVSSNLVDAIFLEYTGNTLEDDKADLRNSLSKARKRLSQILYKDETNNYQVKEEGSKEARQNEIFDIYKSILTNPAHRKEIFTPAEFEDFKALKKEIDAIFNTSDNSINPLTDKGQRTFRKRNIAGRSLKGIAANLNAFGAISQVSKMNLKDNLSFKFKFDLTKYNKKELKDRYKDDVEFKEGFAYIKFKNLGFAPNESYLNVDGNLILEHASQGIGAAVDIAKDPTFDSFNATTYTYPLFHTMLLAGLPTRTAGMFIRQPILKALNDYYFDTKSLLGDTSGNQIESVKRFYQTQLYLELLKQNKVKPDKKLQKTLDRRTKDNIVNTYDKKYLIYVDRKDSESLLQYNPDELEVFDVEQLKNQLVLNSKGFAKMSADEKLSYLKTQLQVLEYFNTWKKAGEGVQDILQASKTDSIGAGPTMDTTSNLIRLINRLEKNDRVIIDDKPAILSLYPSHFGIDKESSYSPVENYLNFGNKLSVDILSKLFITQSQSFKDVITTINGLSKINLDDQGLKNVNKFLNVATIQDFDLFKSTNKEEVLGVNSKFSSAVKDFDTFKSLSAANKIFILQAKQKEFLKENPQHILNFVTPLLEEDDIKTNGYHKIDFLFYKNEFTDDNLADSITKMYQSGDEYEKDLALSLIQYSYVTNGLTFGLQSFAKVIPNEILYSLGFGDYLRDKQKLLSSTKAFDSTIVDQFYRNNWNNSSMVPTVRTIWDYTINDKGKKVIRTDKDGNRYTKDGGPVWNSKSEVLIIPDKALKDVDTKVKNAPYINIATKEGGLLYKKYTSLGYTVELDPYLKSSFDGNTYYYKIGKLGKDGIYEFSNSSMFNENNIEQVEAILVNRIIDVIEKINQQKTLDLNNTSKEKQEEIAKKCGYGN